MSWNFCTNSKQNFPTIRNYFHPIQRLTARIFYQCGHLLNAFTDTLPFSLTACRHAGSLSYAYVYSRDIHVIPCSLTLYIRYKSHPKGNKLYEKTRDHKFILENSHFQCSFPTFSDMRTACCIFRETNYSQTYLSKKYKQYGKNVIKQEP